MATGRRSIPWPYVGLGALTVLAAVLVVLALRPPDPPPPTIVLDPASSPAPTLGPPGASPGTVDSNAEDESQDEAMESPDIEPAPNPEPQRERPLDAVSSQAAIRGVPGQCPGGGAVIEVTGDQGRTWVPLPTPTDLLLRVAQISETDLWFVGADAADCAPGYTTSGDGGQSWVGPSETTGAWHLLTDTDATTLHAPFSIVDSPCGAERTLEIESQSFEAASVLCGNGEVFSTINGGASWDVVGQTPGAVALAVVSDRAIVAVPTGGDCDGLSIGSPGTQAIGCVDGAPSVDVGMTFGGANAGWVVADDQTWTSNDAGSTWTRRS